ncbi:hypothetical protein [Desulfococcus sp.]|uniref:hypothetical protein n=1 Tax=Desulfococcus sp. TaxID=2025834 RepID=UPI003592FB59
MRFHKVEIDDDVFQYVKENSEPLVDTFNSTLRRLLLGNSLKAKKLSKRDPESTTKNGLLPILPGQTPQALRHTLEVAYLVQSGAYDRSDATQFVAKQHGVFPQTVLDKYCRQLNLKAREFDRLLEQPGLIDLKHTLKAKFPQYKQLIDETLS